MQPSVLHFGSGGGGLTQSNKRHDSINHRGGESNCLNWIGLDRVSQGFTRILR